MPLHHTALEFKRHQGTAELQVVWKKPVGRQDEEQRGRDRCRKEGTVEREGEKGGNRGHPKWSSLTFTFTSYLRPHSPQQVLKIVEAAD